MHHDRTLICIDCGADFTFTIDEQEFYAAHQLTNEPKRCKPCREKRKNISRQGSPPPPVPAAPPGSAPPAGPGPEARGSEIRPRHRIVCHACGMEDEVPFRPQEGREVYCHRCYADRRR